MIRDFFQDDREYFANSKGLITAQNNHMLIDGCIIYAGVLAFYTIFSFLTDQDMELRQMYYFYDAIHLAICLAVFIRPARLKKNFLATQLYCIIFEITVLSFFTLEGACITPTQHSLYVPIAIILVQILFVHRALYNGLIALLYSGSFAFLAYLYKIPEAYTNDIFIAIATFFSANIGCVLISKLRHNESRALIKYEILSKTDILTGLYNKATMEEICRQNIAESNYTSAFVIIDLDGFKMINDKYGHHVGDEVLKKVGMILKGSFRVRDLIGRFGGDEFFVLMDSCSDIDIVYNRLDHLKGQFAELQFSSPDIVITYSAGITFSKKDDDFKSVFLRADHALYAAKDAGKGCCRVE